MTGVLGTLDSVAVAEIRSASEKAVRAIVASDWDKWLQYVDDEPVMMPPNVGPLDGRAKVRAFLEAFPTILALRLSPVEIDRRADLACVRGQYELTAGGVSDRGSYVELWRKQGDGSWKFRNMWNSDLAAPALDRKAYGRPRVDDQLEQRCNGSVGVGCRSSQPTPLGSIPLLEV